MKFFTFTDIHSDIDTMLEIVERVNEDDIEIVVFVGDISWFGQGTETMFDLLGMINKTVLLIPGNHDSEDEINAYCEIYPNCVNINHKKYEHNGTLFVGYGEGGFSMNDPKLKFLSKKFKNYFDEHDGKKVLLLHGPPYGTTTDAKASWYEDDSSHCGCKVARKLIEDTQVDLVLTGHIHEFEGESDYIGETMVLNPSHKGRIITLE